MKIILDAMGGDLAPEAPVLGAIDAAKDFGAEITLVGRSEEILEVMRKNGYNDLPKGVEIAGADDVVDMHDDPGTVIHKRKNSSMVIGLRLLADGQGDAFVSAGSTGALLTGATLIVKRMKGIRRAAMGPAMPNKKGGNTVICDCGANAECTPEFLLQFGLVGAVYAKKQLGIENPKVGLLNIGEEDTKGDLFAQEAHRLLSETVPAFAGNCEGGDLMAGDFDVVVTDGFTGNVCLKTIEGTAKTLMRNLKAALMSTALSKVGALLVKGPLGALKEKMSPDTYGGTPLLGVKGAVIVGHGSSNETAVKNGIAVAAATVRAHVPEVIAERVAAAPASASATVGAEEKGEAAVSDAR